jgi:hypothetical protein
MASASLTRARWQAALACGGATVLWWRTHAGAAMGLVAVTSIMLAGAWLAPRLYAPVQQALDRLLGTLLQALSWAILAVVYFGVFTPLRAVRAIMGGSWLTRNPRTDPETSSFSALPPSAIGRFDRQF